MLSLGSPVRPLEVDICFCLPCIFSPSGMNVPSWELPSSVDLGLTVSAGALLSPSPWGGHKTSSLTKQTSQSGEWWTVVFPSGYPYPLKHSLFLSFLGMNSSFFLGFYDLPHVPSVHFFFFFAYIR